MTKRLLISDHIRINRSDDQDHEAVPLSSWCTSLLLSSMASILKIITISMPRTENYEQHHRVASLILASDVRTVTHTSGLWTISIET